jgi:hypothetical protein
MLNFNKLLIFFLFAAIGFAAYGQNWKRNIAPLVGYRGIYQEKSFGGNISMIELGAAYISGTKQVDRILFIPAFSGWRYFGPFVSIDAKFRSPEKLGSNAMMLNMGITGGTGGFFSSIFPSALNGVLAYSTDFRNSYLRIGIAYDLCYISLGGGVLSNINGGQYISSYDNQLYLEVRLLLWRNSRYFRN